MSKPRYLEWDALDDFNVTKLRFYGEQRDVYVAGTGPAVIVMSEMPGIYSLVADFARRVREAGFTVWMPHLFGTPGRPVSRAYLAQSLTLACIRREFRVLAANASSPVTRWLRALAAYVHPQCGGRGVGAIGMCFTGNFALSMMLEPAVRAPVLAQPSLPLFPPAGVHVSQSELETIRERLETEDLSVKAYRFEGDPMCRAERFEALSQALGERFEARVLPDSAGAQEVPMRPHSVVTLHLVDREGEPTRAALDEILEFFAHRLREARN